MFSAISDHRARRRRRRWSAAATVADGRILGNGREENNWEKKAKKLFEEWLKWRFWKFFHLNRPSKRRRFGQATLAPKRRRFGLTRALTRPVS